MSYLDGHTDVLEWASEEFCIPYKSPIDGRTHRYFPDFWVKQRSRDGSIEVKVIEVKPAKQSAPPKPQSRMTKKYINEVATWGVNQAKWKAAESFCKHREWQFVVMTEKELGIK